jgi:gliding motility-associated-like protein
LKVIGLLIAILVNCTFFVKAQGYIEFVENKGQWDNNILYNGKITGGRFALTKTGYKVLKYDATQLARLSELRHHKGTLSVNEDILKGHVWNVDFLNANTNATVTSSKSVEGISNYFIGDDPKKWGTNCKSFTAISYKNIYDKIDINYYTSNGTLKYDIIVHPGGDVSKIQLAYNGVDKVATGRNGEVVVHTSIGKFSELSPYTFQSINNQKKVIDCSYKIKNSVLTFNMGDYDKTQTLVIDPTLIFSTHSGSTEDNWGFTATYGPDETFYGGGYVDGAGFLVSGGAFQTTYSGNIDIGIIKLSANGVNRIYATYIGGSNYEQPHSLVCDLQGNLIVAGRTKSSNFPSTSKFGPGGEFDITLTKLNPAGTGIIGSMIIGGSGDDGVNISPTRTQRISLQYNYGDDGRSEVNIDAAGNIILASSTQSSNFYTTPFPIQSVLGGTQDAVFIKTNSTLSNVLFSTYFGGTGNDAAYVVNIKPDDGNIYFAGGTESSNLLGDRVGVVQPANAGNADGFVTIIKPDGSGIVKTTYIGTNLHDQIYGIQFDKFFFPYIMGISLGNWSPINSAFSNPGSHQFIAKLEKDLSNYVYRTNFGTNSSLTNISPVAFLVDKCQNVYVSGWGGNIFNGPNAYTNAGTNGMPITPDAIQSTTDGRDFYYFVLERNGASQLFGSYFGGTSLTSEHVDGGTSRFDPKGYIYQAACASCGGIKTAPQSYPTTIGSWRPINGSSGCNLGMTKIRFNLNGVGADLRASDTMGCVPLKVDFQDVFLNAVSYEFNFGDGSGNIPSATPTISHTFNTPGYYKVRMIAIDLNSCNLRDTSYKNIRVRNDRAFVDFIGLKQPPCENLSYSFNNLSIAPVGKPFGSNSFKWDFDDGSPILTTGVANQLKTYTSAGTYNVKLYLSDTNYCNSPDTIIKQFRLSPKVQAIFKVDNGCAPFTYTFENTSLAGASFEWLFGDGGSSTATSPTHTYNLQGTYTVRLVANDPNTCNLTDTLRLPITINPTPVADFTYSPNPSLVNTPTQFTNTSISANIYKWKFGDGDSSTLANPLHQYNSTGTFNVCLTAANQFGCRDTICEDVPAIVQPLLDVPNALTPNGDGKNDKVFVRGFGIKTMIWRIYNRWGQLVFETTNRNEGWDGTFKGQLQPMEAYGYTLSVEMSDGQKIKKSGDITLIR